MRQKKNRKFRFAFVLYLCILAVLAIAAIIYVKVLLVEYERSQPERVVSAQMEEISAMAKDGSIESYFPFPNVTPGKFEFGADIKGKYYEMFASDKLDCVLESKELDGSAAVYKIKSGEVELASVNLKSDGIPHQKLIIFVYYDWQVESITPVVKKQNYDIEVPADYTVSLNGIPLGVDELVVDQEGEVKDDTLKRYHVEGLYLQPDFRIVTGDGTPTDYNIIKNKVTPVIFDYTLVIPSTLSVTVNGKENPGTDAGGGMIRHAIREIEEPEVTVSDEFGNTLKYAGENRIPLTYKRITVPESYRVSADGRDIPESSAVRTEDEELDEVRRFADIPDYMEYAVAVLKDNAPISIKDGSGRAVDLSGYENADVIDLAGTISGAESVPDEILSEIDVLTVAEMWSKFMSADLEGGGYGFWNLSEYLIEGSKLYDDALKWANGIDITFTSIHTLGNPPFTDEKVTNYIRLGDDCFRCDISFVKHMFISGRDEMKDNTNLRFYFVRNNGYGSPWRVAYIKEIVE